MDLVLQRAQAVGHPLQGVLDGMGEVVHGVDAPLVPGLMMGDMDDPIEGRVPHVDVGGGHVDLGPEGLGAVFELPVLHALEQIQILLHGPIPVGAVLPGLRQGTPVGPHLLLGEVIHVGHALSDQLLGQFVALVEVRGTEDQLVPLEPQPADVLLDGVHVLRPLLGGVGVVVTEVAGAAVLLRHGEVDGQRLSMADV